MKEIKNSRKDIRLAVIILSATILSGLLIFILITLYQNRSRTLYSVHPALTRTTRVGGLLAYNIRLDDIIDIPESFFDAYNHDPCDYDTLVGMIGEPSGTIGSGIVREYWRIGENKYAVFEYNNFHICSKDSRIDYY